MPQKTRLKVICGCPICNNSKLVEVRTRDRHMEQFANLQHSITSQEDKILNSMGDSDKDDIIENDAPTLPDNMEIDEDEQLFSYDLLADTTIPEQYRKNFTWLSWKIRCNVSDNAYNQSIGLMGDGYMKLEVCRRLLAKWSGITCMEFDCCRRGELSIRD